MQFADLCPRESEETEDGHPLDLFRAVVLQHRLWGSLQRGHGVRARAFLTCQVEEEIIIYQSMDFRLRQTWAQHPAPSPAGCDFGQGTPLCLSCLVYKRETLTILISQALGRINHMK